MPEPGLGGTAGRCDGALVRANGGVRTEGSPYSTSKWGVIRFTNALAIELGQFGIRP